MWRILFPLVVSACLVPDALVDDYLDRDGDGVWTDLHPDGTDCDDTQADVYPGADELCDGLDNNCDGIVDLDALDRVAFADLDGDGHAGPTRICEAAEGAMAEPTDCNDEDPTVHPEAAELCGNDVDDNCNGAVDDGLPVMWVADGDDDGWGQGEGGVSSCAAVPGLAMEGDCDDLDPHIHPGAYDEAYDGIDADCAGDDDYDLDNDGHRASADVVDDPSYTPPLVPDCDDRRSDVYPGAIDTPYDGVDADCAGDDDYDGDGDGEPASPYGSDCNDSDGSTLDGSSAEIPGDGVDQDCDGEDLSIDDAPGVFVSATGIDESGCGSWQHPCQTLQFGHAVAMERGGPMYIAGGEYEGGLLTSVSLLGGFDAETWQRDMGRWVTTIDIVGNLGLDLRADNVLLDGVTVRTGRDPASRAAGIVVTGARTLIQDVRFPRSTTDGNCAGIYIAGDESTVRRFAAEPCASPGWSRAIHVGPDANSVWLQDLSLEVTADHGGHAVAIEWDGESGRVESATVRASGLGYLQGILAGAASPLLDGPTLQQVHVEVQGGDPTRTTGLRVTAARMQMDAVRVDMLRSTSPGVVINTTTPSGLLELSNLQLTASGTNLTHYGDGLVTVDHATVIGGAFLDQEGGNVTTRFSVLQDVETIGRGAFQSSYFADSCPDTTSCVGGQPLHASNATGMRELEPNPSGLYLPGADSPLVDHAIGSTLESDFMGEPRPQGAAPDIGAFETW